MTGTSGEQEADGPWYLDREALLRVIVELAGAYPEAVTVPRGTDDRARWVAYLVETDTAWVESECIDGTRRVRLTAKGLDYLWQQAQ